MNATKRPYRQSWSLALVFALSLAFIGCDHATDFEGPGLIDRFGEFNLVEAISASTESVDFAGGENVVFMAEFNKQVNWVVEITGQESGAVKRLEGFSKELTAENAVWRGSTTELPLFKDEAVEAALFVPQEDSDTTRVTLDVLTPRLYPGNIVANFEADSEADIAIGNFEFELDLVTGGISDEVPPAQGDAFFLFRGTEPPSGSTRNFFVGLIDITPSDESFFAVPTSNPDNLYFNAFIYSFGAPNTIAVIQVIADGNGSGGFEDGQDTVFPVYDMPVEGEGWQAISVQMSNLPGEAPPVISQAQAQQIVAVRVLLISDNNAQPATPLEVEYGIDYITFTGGGPLQL